MLKLKIIIFGILVMCFCTGLYGHSAEEFVEDNLDDALVWMFEEGIPKYYLGVPEREIGALLYKEKYTLIYYASAIRSHRPYSLLSFTLWDVGKSKKTNMGINMFYNVLCYLIDIQADNVIEYWVIIRQLPSWAERDGEPRFQKCLFKITVADSIYSSRRVEVESDNFIDSTEAGGRTIRFPKDNLFILYSLAAYKWPKSYENSDLDDYIVKFKKGEPYLKKLNWFCRALRDASR